MFVLKFQFETINFTWNNNIKKSKSTVLEGKKASVELEEEGEVARGNIIIQHTSDTFGVSTH